MAIQEIWTNTLWALNEGGGGYSQSATVNLPHRMPFAVAQVALTRSAYFGTPAGTKFISPAIRPTATRCR